MHIKYGHRFPDFHLGMLELLHVPNYTGIFIHIGNTDDDTAGCLLTGNGAQYGSNAEVTLQYSTDAYRRVYPLIAAPLDAGEDVLIDIVDRDR